jgi:F-type H+-transporting ATPase subunit a
MIGAVAPVAPVAADAAAHQAPHAAAAFDVTDLIMHHITDGPDIEIPFTNVTIPLKQIHVGSLDLSITRHVVMMWIAAGLVLLIGIAAARRSAEPVPRGWRNVLEAFIRYFRDDIARKLIGHDGDRYLPYLLTSFFFIWACNLLGLVPGFSTPTSNIGVTAGLAGFAFVMIQVSGVRQFGLLTHLKNVVPGGLPLWLYPIMIPVEILGLFTKPFALCVRLFANMTAGHVVVIGLISLIFILKSAWVATLSVPFTLFIFVLELLVCFIQAYIFTTLVATFIGMSVHPAH